jgi:hypothetical protein
MKCPDCETINTPESELCDNCGYRFTPGENDLPTITKHIPKRHTGRNVAILALVGILVEIAEVFSEIEHGDAFAALSVAVLTFVIVSAQDRVVDTVREREAAQDEKFRDILKSKRALIRAIGAAPSDEKKHQFIAGIRGLLMDRFPESSGYSVSQASGSFDVYRGWCGCEVNIYFKSSPGRTDISQSIGRADSASVTVEVGRYSHL